MFCREPSGFKGQLSKITILSPYIHSCVDMIIIWRINAKTKYQ